MVDLTAERNFALFATKLLTEQLSLSVSLSLKLK
jgi:hypothetical protein